MTIKTSWGKALGMGHIQRMATLLWYLNERKNIKTFLISDAIPDFFPVELRNYVKTNIDFKPDIIIRDMRDSTEDEITHLKKTGKVIVIDDNGPGRRLADHAIDILPNPDPSERRKKDSGIFIYGYNFLKAVSDLKGKTIKKELDFAIYPGNSPTKEYIDFLISLLPDNSTYTLLNGENSYLVKNGKKLDACNSSYAEIVLSSRVVISHFGITLYEGYISGCRLISINPTPYHSLLSEMAKDFLSLINLGEFKIMDPGEARFLIQEAVKMPLHKNVNSGHVYKKIIAGLENFYELVFSLI